MTSLDLKSLILEGILITIPESVLIITFALILFGFKDKLSINKVLLFSLLVSFAGIASRLTLEKYGLHQFAMPILGIVCIRYIFKIDFVSSIISMLISSLLYAILQVVFVLCYSSILSINFNDLISRFNSPSHLSTKLQITYLFTLLFSTILFVLYRKNAVLINLNKYKLFSNLQSNSENEYKDTLKMLLVLIIPVFIFLIIHLSIYYYQAFNGIEVSSLFYLAINSLALVVSYILMFFLVKKIISLKHYKIEWKTQQNHLNDINELLKRLRAQKHGFINHMNVIFGLLTLGEHENAKQYLANIHQTISVTNAISVNNPTLSALLNIKAGIAESKNIRYEVNVSSNLSQINFKAFEIGEAIGNIIDNAFEATCEQAENDRYVRIDINSDDNSYIFQIQNTGRTIPEDMINRIFEQGFTTKSYESGDHGFGLYITKNIIESHHGKVKVESENNKTSFKIYLPKVMQNEIKVS